MITLAGELDATSAGTMAWYLDTELDAAAGDVVLDVSALDVGPCGLDLLIQAHRHLAARGRRLYVEGASRSVDRDLAAAHFP